ncbi:DUF3488 and transglutaminase-like domain-containing protein [Planctomycetaceae bacterium SH139]
MSPRSPEVSLPRIRFDRRRVETLAMACIPMLALWLLRLGFESPMILAIDLVSILLSALLLGVALLRRASRPLVASLTAWLLLTPLASGLFARYGLAAPLANEMIGLTTLGCIGIAVAMLSRGNRGLTLAIISSGFLALFTAFTSDDFRAVGLPVIWMLVCIWHLVANHWERLEVCLPARVQRSATIRPLTVVFAVLISTAGGLLVHGRLSTPNKIGWGVMPTSGGSQWSDPSANSGVGSGDAAIAAQEHADSFGAVDSNIFLESDQSSLYDMFSEALGEPIMNRRQERRQGLNGQQVQENHKDLSQSHKGGGSFSLTRSRPSSAKRHQEDKLKRDVLQWIGPTGISLALHHYDRFDGIQWHPYQGSPVEYLHKRHWEGQHWFLDPRRQQAHDRPDLKVNSLKVIRLDSNRLASPMMTLGVHIKDVERPDFFAIGPDDCWYMPAREKVPSLSIVHYLSEQIWEDDLLVPGALMRSLPSQSQPAEPTPELTLGRELAARLAAEWTASIASPYQQMRTIVEHLRRDFQFDRTVASDQADPLAHFLTHRRGGDHLFAAAAAEMLRSLGLKVRLATGFYVSQARVDYTAGHTAILPEDAHVWPEVRLRDGRWIGIEPTPGFLEPSFQPSWKLVCQRALTNTWPTLAGGSALLVFLIVTRLYWIDWLLLAVWTIRRWTPERRRISLTVRILEMRAKVAKCPRALGVNHRDWLASLAVGDSSLADNADQFCVAAEQIIFGQRAAAGDWSHAADSLIRNMNLRFFSQHRTSQSTERT